MNKKKILDYWNLRARKKILKCTNDVNLETNEISVFLSIIKNKKNVLDIGCGEGELLRNLKKKNNCNCYGIDFSQNLIKIARRKSKNINFYCIDMNKIKEGLILDGYNINVENISYVRNSPKKEIGIEIYVIKNSILKHYPQLENNIDKVIIGTPLTNSHYLNTEYGECYGLEHTPDRYISNIQVDKKFLEINDIKWVSLDTIKYSIENKKSVIKLRTVFEQNLAASIDDIVRFID